MTATILHFPTPKPRLVVPTSPKIVELWAELHQRIADNHANPCRHNRNMIEAARARYVAACLAENFPV